MRRVAELVDDEDWRVDKRRSWSAILQQLVRHMDWETGLITGLTAERLGAAGTRAPRTVSRVLAWAREIGFLVVVEVGASAEFLGTEHGRTPTYALVTAVPPMPIVAPVQVADAEDPAVEESGDLPNSSVDIEPLKGGRRAALQSERKWPSHTVPDDPNSRNAATLTLLTRLGLGGRRNGKIEIWRARALLKPWWDNGASVAGLLHAIEYHPDRPGRRRGDVSNGAGDPLRIVGARLRPWINRLHELPAGALGFPRVPTSSRPAEVLDRPAGRAARYAAREALHLHLEQLRARRQAQR